MTAGGDVLARFTAGIGFRWILLDRRTAANGHPTFWNGLLVLQRTG